MAERIKGLQIDLSMKDMGVQRSISEIKRSFKGLNADLKLSNNNFKYSEKSLNSYKLRTRELSQAVKESKANVAALKAKYQEAARASGVNSKKAAQLRQEYSRQADNLNYLQNELDQTRGKYREMIAVSKSSVGRLGQTFSEIGPKIRSIGDSMKSVGRNMSLHVTAPIAAGFGAAMKKSIDFDDTMRKVKATSGATGDEFNQLRTKALQMGQDTKFTASESAEAMNYMALAGWDTKDMLKGVGGVMDLAAASGEDLASVSDIVTDNLTAFGMKAKDSTHFADVLAQTSSKANTDVRGLGEAFKYAAPVAGALGYSVEDTSIAIGLMSNAGIKGEKAGTALRTMFTNLSKPTKAMKDEMDKLGISITDSNGEMLPMRDVLDQLRGKMGGLSKDQQAAAASTIFGKEAMSGALAVINASDEDYKKLTKSIDGSKGASKRMADEMEGGIGGAMRKMKSAIESLAISLGDALAPMLYKVATWVKNLANKFTNLPSGIQKTIAVVGLLAAAIGPLVLVMGMFTSAIGSIATTLGPVMVSIAKAGGLMSFLSGKASIAAKGLSMLGGASGLLLNPVGLVVAGIAALGTAFVIAYKKSETFRNVVNGVLEAIKNSFVILWNVLKPIMAAIWDIIKTVFQQINDAGNEIIQMLSEQFGPAFNDVGNIVKSLQPVFETVMHAIKAVVDFVMPGIKAMFQNTFNGIKNIVTGALDIILGVVKIFVSLFTGNFKLMWSGVKQIFSGFIKIIVGIFKVSFVGQIIAFAKGMWTKVKQIFLNLWKGTKAIFSTLGVWIGKKWQEIKNSVVDKAKGLWSGVKAIWNFLKTGTIKIMAAIAVWLIKKWTAIKKSVVNKAKALWDGVKDAWNALKTGTIKIIASVAVWLIKKWSAIKKSVVNKVKDLWSGVKKTWGNLKNGTTKTFKAVGSFMSSKWNSIKKGTINKSKALWSGVKNAWNNLKKGTHNTMSAVGGFMSKKWNGIKSATVSIVNIMKSKVMGTVNKMRDGIKTVTGKIGDLFGGMIKGVKKGLNGLIKGVNWVADKLSMEKIDPIKLSTGTQSTHTQRYVTNGKINKDTMATVGDRGRGNGPGGFRHEMIRYPNGKTTLTPNRDTTTFLPKGSSVLNGAQTHSLLNSLPKFSLGTNPLGNRNKKPKKKKKGDNLFGDAWDAIKGGAAKVVDGGKAVVSKTLDAASKGKKWLSDKVGDVLDWIDKPEKLLEKVLEGFGVNLDSFGITKAAELPYNMMKGMFGKLKKAAIEKFKEWFEDSGSGDGGYIDLSKGINFGFARTAAEAARQGYPFARAHHGLDINYKYDKVYSTLSGIATGSSGYNGGFGQNMWIRAKNGLEAIYGHLHKLAFHGKKRVKPGTYLGISGGDPGRDGQNAGSSTGPHLHYEMRRNGVAFDPTKWLKTHNGGGSQNKSASKWKGDIKRAAKKMKVNLSNRELNGIVAQIARESNGNAGVTQGNIGDINNLRGTPAQGLLQYVPSTFKSYAVKGHKNIKNGYDQLLAFFNNSNWRRDLPYGKSGWGPSVSRRFATGGLINSPGLYNLAEEGHPEFVIPTDPSRQSDAMKLLAIATQKIEGNKKNKRPNQLRTPSVTSNTVDNAELLLQMIENQQKQINVLMEIARSNKTIEKQPKGFSERDVSQAQGSRLRLAAYSQGGL